MKIKSLLIVFLLVFSSSSIFGQFAFGVKPGLGINSSYFGVKMDQIVPFVGINYFRAGFEITGAVDLSGLPLSKSIQSDDSPSTEGSITLYNLMVGAKFYLMKKKDVSGYVTGSFSHMFLSSGLEIDGENVEEFEDIFDDVNINTLQFGFGGEYFFAENFSIGGEFGLRFFLIGYEPSSSDDSSDGSELSLNVSHTYEALSLNFYF